MEDNFTKIIDTIISDAQCEASKIISDAQNKAKSLVSSSKNEIDNECAQKRAQCQKQANITSELVSSNFESVRRDEIISKKHGLTDDAFTKALDKLTKLPNDKKLALYVDWIKKYADSDNYTITLANCDKSLKDDMIKAIKGGILPGKPTLNEKFGKFSGGVVLEYEFITKKLTFEACLAEIKEQHEIDVMNILFGKA